MKQTAAFLLVILALPVFPQDAGWRELANRVDQLRDAGHYASAEKALQDLWRDAKKPGRGELIIAATYNDAGFFYQQTGRCLEARRAYEHALEIWVRLGVDEAVRAHTAANLAALAVDCGAPLDARGFYDRYLAKWGATLSQDDPQRARLLDIHAAIYLGLNKLREAERLFLESLAIWEKAGHPESVALVASSLSVLYSRIGDREHALQYADKSGAMLEQYLFNYPMEGRLLANLGMVHERAGDLEGARVLFARALSISQERFGPHHALTAEVMTGYSDLLRKMKRKAEAAEMAKAAKSIQAENSSADWGSVLNANQASTFRGK